jgi:hypothetical protein
VPLLLEPGLPCSKFLERDGLCAALTCFSLSYETAKNVAGPQLLCVERARHCYECSQPVLASLAELLCSSFLSFKTAVTQSNCHTCNNEAASGLSKESAPTNQAACCQPGHLQGVCGAVHRANGLPPATCWFHISTRATIAEARGVASGQPGQERPVQHSIVVVFVGAKCSCGYYSGLHHAMIVAQMMRPGR